MMFQTPGIFLANILEFAVLIILRYFFRKSEKYNNVQVFISSAGIGDFIIQTNLFKALNKDQKYKNYLITRSDYISLHSENEPELISWNRTKFKYNIAYRISLINKIRNLRAYRVVNLNRARSYYDDQITLCSGAKLIHGMSPIPSNVKKLFKDRVDKYYDSLLFPSLNLEYDKIKLLIKYLNLPFIQEKQTSSEKKDKRIRVIVAPFASLSKKEWPFDNYKLLIEWLSSSSNTQISLIGKSKRTLKYESPGITNLINKLTISEVQSLMSNCDLLITNDSGLAHLGKYYNIPRIVLAGGGSFGHYWPYGSRNNEILLWSNKDCFGCEWHCKYLEARCLTEVSVDMVKKSVNTLLKNGII